MSVDKLIIFAGIGVLVGFICFTISIATVGGIFIRGNPPKFTLQGFHGFLTAPFQPDTSPYNSVWGIIPGGEKLKLKDKFKSLSMNWVMFASIGAIVGAVSSFFF
jgi:hypothetical protein